MPGLALLGCLYQVRLMMLSKDRLGYRNLV
jgi:hypothetical protein